MTGVCTITVAPDEAELRLDRWFRRHYPQLGHGRLEKLLRTGQVRVDGKRVKSGTRLAAGQSVRVPPLPGPSREQRKPSDVIPRASSEDVAALRNAVLFKDDAVIAVDKAPGLAVQGGSGQRRHIDAMLDGLRFGGDERPRLVHRLDKDTSGVLLLARTAASARRLAAAFKGKAAQKIYWALVVGVPAARRGHIDLPLAKQRDGTREKVRGMALEGRPAQTLYQVVETRKVGGSGISWLVLMPLTGRTHQLRAHCAALGTPILCDGKYGGRAAFPEALPFDGADGLVKRLMLQAHEIALPHPEDDTTLRVAAPLPPHMAAAWSYFGFDPAKGEPAANSLIDYAGGLAHSPPGARPGPRRQHGKARGRKQP